MALLDLRREGAVFVLTMTAGENRFNRPLLNALHAALDEVERSSGPAALVTTGGEEKFFSNGLDLGWLSGDGASEGPAFVSDFIGFLGRVFAFPVPTVAAINGHAFAGGGMLALAHDFRVMRADRGFICFNEVDIKFPLAPGMTAIIKSRLTPPVCRDMILTGVRFGGIDAQQRGVVDEAVPAGEVLARAITRAAALADKDRATYAALKRGMYRDVLTVLEQAALE